MDEDQIKREEKRKKKGKKIENEGKDKWEKNEKMEIG